MSLYYDATVLNEMVAERSKIAIQHEDCAKFLLDTSEKTHDDMDLRKRRAEGERHAVLRRELDSIDMRIEAMKRLEPSSIVTRGQSPIMRWLRSGDNGLEESERKEMVLPCADDVAATFPALAGKSRFIVHANPDFVPEMVARSDTNTGAGAVGNANVVNINPNVVDRLAYYGNIEPFCTTFVTADGGEYRFNYVDDANTEGELIDQSSTSNTAQDVPTVGIKTFRGNLMNSKPMNIRLEAFQDVHFDLQGRAELMALARMQKGWTTQFTNGNGTAPQPMGLLNAAKDGTTAASATAITYADLLNTVYAVDMGYRDEVVDTVGLVRPQAGQVGWIFSDNFEKTIRGLLDGDSRPLWTPGIMSGTWGITEAQPPRLMGHPYRINNKMPDVATGQKVALFGNFSYYGIRTVGSMEMYSLVDSNTLASHSAQVIAFSRRDAHAIGGFDAVAGAAGDCEAFQTLKMA